MEDLERELLVAGEAQLSEGDFREAWGAVPAFRRLRAYAMALPIFCAALLLVSVLSNEHEGQAAAQLAQILPILLIPTMSVAFLLTARRSWAKRAISDLGTGRVTFRFNAHGLEVESELRQHRLAWAALPQHIEGHQSFLVYTGSQTLLLVPKRAFNEYDLATVKQLLQQRIPPLASKSPLPRLLVIWAVLLVLFLSIWHVLSIPPH